MFMYTTQNGSLAIVYPVPKEVIEANIGPMTDDEYVAHVKERSIPSYATDATLINISTLPTDMSFRDAWTNNSGVVGLDLTKAKAVQLARIREARASKFTPLDDQFMRAIETNDTATQASVASKKQALRDITNPLKALVPVSIADIQNAFPASLLS